MNDLRWEEARSDPAPMGGGRGLWLRLARPHGEGGPADVLLSLRAAAAMVNPHGREEAPPAMPGGALLLRVRSGLG